MAQKTFSSRPRLNAGRFLAGRNVRITNPRFAYTTARNKLNASLGMGGVIQRENN